jgi:hypothetical protein
LEKLQEIEEMSETIEECECPSAQDIYNSEKQRIEHFITELKNISDAILKKLSNKAEQIFKLFNDFGSPWDIQFNSFSKLQDSIVKQLQLRAEKVALSHLDLQKNINNEVVNLREESSVEKLDKKLVQVFAIVDRKDKK